MDEFRVIIAGGRTFNDYNMLKQRVDAALVNVVGVRKIVIISGTANGADKLGERYAQEMGYTLVSKPADWDRHGKSAGYRRNDNMASIAHACICFWDGESRGTQHMINIAKHKGLKIKVIRY